MKQIIYIVGIVLSIQIAFAQDNSLGRIYGSFKPEKGEKYIVSAWVKEIHAIQQRSYVNSSVSVHFDTAQAPNIFLPSGVIIDGWQRIVGMITIPTDSPNIDIRLNNNSPGSQTVYFDDVRFFPYNGNLKSFVYDENTQRLMSELDEKNYATFYKYDAVGGLILVQKETERGIYTIQETRSYNKKIENINN